MSIILILEKKKTDPSEKIHPSRYPKDIISIDIIHVIFLLYEQIL